MLRWLGLGAAALVAVACLVAVVARFSDGPIGPFPGGPRVAGELVRDSAPDWSSARDTGSIELEVNPESRRSREEAAVAGEGVWFFRMDPRPPA